MPSYDPLITRARATGDLEYSQPASRESIDKLAEELKVKLPVSYEVFMGTYGVMEFGGFRVSGIYANDPIRTNEGCAYGDTIRSRERFGIPEAYVVVEYDQDGEILYCLDTTVLNATGECPVIFYDIFYQKTMPASNTFESWLSVNLEARLTVRDSDTVGEYPERKKRLP